MDAGRLRGLVGQPVELCLRPRANSDAVCTVRTVVTEVKEQNGIASSVCCEPVTVMGREGQALTTAGYAVFDAESIVSFQYAVL